MTEEEIVTELREIGVIAARHFRRKVGDAFVNLKTVTLTFLTNKLPENLLRPV